MNLKSIPLYFPPINKLGNISFRRLVHFYGADFVFTEMVRVEKILEGVPYQLDKLKIPKDMREQTIVQIICEDSSTIEKGIDMIMQMHPYLKEINYNMGCPQSTMAKCEMGGGIVGNPDKVEAIAKALVKACKKYHVRPSIKIRLGITREEITIFENAKRIYNAGISKLYIHGRCLRDGYSKKATHEEIARVKCEMGDTMEIIVNGDIVDSLSFEKVCSFAHFDGVLIGRAALENPKIFSEIKQHFQKNLSGNPLSERKDALLLLLDFAKKDRIDISKIKQNMMYMTKNTIGGAEFRFAMNNATQYQDLVELCKSL
jgi:tRNA-dihydrouridine synthase B